MSRMAMPSVWKLVQIATRSLEKVLSAHSMTSCGSWSSYSTDSSPASQSSSTTRSSSAIARTMLRELLLCRGDGQGLAGPDTDQLFIRFAFCERLERLASRAFAQVGRDESLDIGRRLGRRHTAQ